MKDDLSTLGELRPGRSSAETESLDPKYRILRAAFMKRHRVDEDHGRT